MLADCELLPDLIVKLFVLPSNQPIDLLHTHIVLLHPCIVGVLDPQHTLGLLVLAGVKTGVCRPVLVVIDGGLRLVLGLNWQLPTSSPDSSSKWCALVAHPFLQYLSAALLIEKTPSGLVAEGDESMYSLHFCILTILGLQLSEQRLLDFAVLVVVGMVEAIHAVGGPVRVVPDELFWLVEILALEELLGLREGRVRKDGLEVVVLHRRLGRVLHANKIIRSEVKIIQRAGSKWRKGKKGEVRSRTGERAIM